MCLLVYSVVSPLFEINRNIVMLFTCFIILNKVPIYNDAFLPGASVTDIVNGTSNNQCFIVSAEKCKYDGHSECDFQRVYSQCKQIP